jgi:hypothetical protein
MDIHKALALLRKSKEKDLIPEDAFLAHAFVMIDEAGNEDWQLGYYSPSSGMMTSFQIGETINALPAAEVLKADVEIAELDPDAVTISPTLAQEAAERARKQQYSDQLPVRTFFIIQHLHVPVYNITLITRQFNTINIRVHATTGEIVSHSCQNLVSVEPGERQSERKTAQHPHAAGGAQAGNGHGHAGKPDKDMVYGKSPAEALKKAQEEAKRRRAGKKN